nr:hypothetical protein [Angustibacter aerolatus]
MPSTGSCSPTGASGTWSGAPSCFSGTGSCSAAFSGPASGSSRLSRSVSLTIPTAWRPARSTASRGAADDGRARVVRMDDDERKGIRRDFDEAVNMTPKQARGLAADRRQQARRRRRGRVGRARERPPHRRDQADEGRRPHRRRPRAHAQGHRLRAPAPDAGRPEERRRALAVAVLADELGPRPAALSGSNPPGLAAGATARTAGRLRQPPLRRLDGQARPPRSPAPRARTA